MKASSLTQGCQGSSKPYPIADVSYCRQRFSDRIHVGFGCVALKTLHGSARSLTSSPAATPEPSRSHQYVRSWAAVSVDTTGSDLASSAPLRGVCVRFTQLRRASYTYEVLAAGVICEDPIEFEAVELTGGVLIEGADPDVTDALSCAHVTTSVRLTCRPDLTAVSLIPTGLQMDRKSLC